MTVLIRGMHGLGDNLHQRPFVRATSEQDETYLATPWPQLYADLPAVKVLPVNTFLRTQRKNVQRGYKWYSFPDSLNARIIEVHYGSNTMTRGSLHDELERLMPLGGRPYINDAPDFGPSPVRATKPIAVVRPVTVRKEWCSVARNPLPEYIQYASKKLREEGFHVVTIADIEHRVEWIEGNTPEADSEFLHGELPVEQLMALIANAALLVTPVGWSLHAGIAYRTPTICIAGGRGSHCAPWKETDPRQDLTKLKWMMPDRYCMCDIQDHNCDKRIHHFERKFDRMLGTMPIERPERNDAQLSLLQEHADAT
jgi:hypothetical protein